MKTYCNIIFSIIMLSYTSNAQVVNPRGFEKDDRIAMFSIPDSILIKNYTDSLKQVFNEELLTGYVYSSLHELVSDIQIEYYQEDGQKMITQTDSLGRFFITAPVLSKAIRVKISDEDYYLFDSVYTISKDIVPVIVIALEAKYKILLRGRIFAGNLPVEEVNITIQHKDNRFTQKTLGCFTDEEGYWNCLYLGIFKQAISFENPKDTVKISFTKAGFKLTSYELTLEEYDGTILPMKLSYTSKLVEYPKNNLGVRIGIGSQNTWVVGMNYIRQLQLGSFNRLGLGIDAAMLMDKISTQLTTFNNLPETTAESSYTIGMIGPLVNFSITDPTNRHFNLYAGIITPIIIPDGNIMVHPYIAGKYYLDLNKALFMEIKYTNYTINASEYVFNSYGNAYESITNKGFQKLIVSFGLMVSF